MTYTEAFVGDRHATPPPAVPVIPAAWGRRQFRMDERRFLAARAAGIFRDGDHVELANGPVVKSGSGLSFRYSLGDYHRAINEGVFTPMDKIELIAGELTEKMAVGERHVACVNQVNVYFVT